MWKKIALLLLALMMVLSLVSCGLDLGDITDDGSDDVGSDSLPIDKDESVQLMENLAQTEGYAITFRYSEDGTDGSYTILSKGDVYCLTAKDEDGYENGTGIVKDGDKCHLYSYNDGEWEFAYTAEGTDAEEFRTVYSSAYSMWLYYGNLYDGMLEKGGSAKIAGRNCTVYTFTYNYGGVIGNIAGLASYKYKVYVDNEFGITMKLEMEVTQQGESASLEYEITSFLTGSAVTVPTFPEPVESEY